MPARTGQEYINGLKEHPREVWIDGERVEDVTPIPPCATVSSRWRPCTTCNMIRNCGRR